MNMQDSVRTGASQAFYTGVRGLSSFMVSITLGLILKELVKGQSLTLIFSTLVFFGLFYKILGRMTILQILVFDLVCVLVGMLLRMYIMIAPNIN